MSHDRYFILEGGAVKEVCKTEHDAWIVASIEQGRRGVDYKSGEWMRRVDYTELGKANVSTVLLPFDHQWGDGPPLIFETMIFGGPHNEWQERCSTLEEARAMHQRAVELARMGS